MLDIRFCRICWNSQNWQKPTGEAARLESPDSYVAKHGFGHEEWLFNFNWLVEGYRYGFLQPIRLANAFDSQVSTVEVILYTIEPLRKRLFVGRIRHCELLTSQFASEAYQVYQHEGWLEEMASHLEQINVDPSLIRNATNPFSIINVRFKPSDAEILEPLITAPTNHKIYSTGRYQPLYAESPAPWKEILSLQTERAAPLQFVSGRLKNLQRRERAAQKGVAFDPAHDRLQEALWKHLRAKYGPQNVGYEVNGVVDLAVKQEKRFIFYEIKMEATTRRCIRLALGQLLEYAHWPAQKRASKLIAVGRVLPKEDDISYLTFLREQYGLPLYYQYYDVVTDTLSPEY